jgi:hypothetical protein
MSADELAVLAERGWMHSTVEGMWENPRRVQGPVSLPEALELEVGLPSESDRDGAKPDESTDTL